MSQPGKLCSAWVQNSTLGIGAILRLSLPRPKTKRLFVAFTLAITTAATAPAAANTDFRAEQWIKLAVAELCGPVSLDGVEAQERLKGTWFLSETSPHPGRIEQSFGLPRGGELRVARLAAGGRMRRFTVAVHQQRKNRLQPAVFAIADPACNIQSARSIRFDVATDMTLLDHLEPDLTTIRWSEVLEAPWPAGHERGGTRVALVDSGLAYDLAAFRNRLARGKDGKPIGYDFWDMDERPYDGDTSRGAFLPIRHGTPVASVLVREAPQATLVPIRYPRPDMTRMAAVIGFAAKNGVRVLAMPLGSNQKQQWAEFEAAMRAHPHMLGIVSAGNNGRDIDREPVWPAALVLDNVVVVTSADGSGRLAQGSNWGRTSVDLMVPAENRKVIDFRGNAGRASGSSYAVPRVAAIAARILANDPSLTAQELKTRIFARAVKSPYERDVVAVGWIPDPTSD
ncbi:MAG: S8 family serine peptidase [Pseudomonadota bacterium]